jgi:PAS domain S-box-containing protein
MFPLLLSAQLLVAGILLAFALLHFLIGSRHPRRGLHITFALTALAAALESVLAGWRYHPRSPQDLVLATKLATSCQFAFGIFVVWFVHAFAGLRGTRVPWCLTASTAAIVALQLALPYGMTFESLPSLRTIRLPWGEEIIASVGRPRSILLLAHATSFSMVCYVLFCVTRLWRTPDEHIRARALAVAYGPLILVAWPHGIFVNRGILPPPHLYSFAFLALVALMSFHMVGETVRVASLTKGVASLNHRWTTLLENVQLLVVGCSNDGLLNYANPHFVLSSGYSISELTGQPFEKLLEPAGRSNSISRFFQIPAGASAYHITSRLRCKDGVLRSIQWSTVPLINEAGEPAGSLSIGSDATERELAEQARDEAMKRLENLAARLEGENLYLKEEIGVRSGVQAIVGESPGIRYVIQQIHLVAKTKAPVLIEGETGVGKELVARALHDLSDRSAGPFIGLNCAAVTPTLIEVELFGAEKGAYTGADKMRKGRFELAESGTLFLDEVGEMPLELQVKLLRVLQENEFERVGGQQTRKFDVRIIAATNRNLQAEIAAGRFREDLYYRLGVYPITVPPLRKRKEDIPLLVQHLVSLTAARHAKTITEIPSHALRQLTDYEWPGNVRELANILERAVISSQGPVLSLPAGFARLPASPAAGLSPAFGTLEAVERKHILAVLERTNGKIHGPGGAAEILAMHPNTLRSRMSRLGIARPGRATDPS